MVRMVSREKVSGMRVRGRLRLGWIDNLTFALGNGLG